MSAEEPWILIVEDDPDAAELLRILMSRRGLTVRCASNGADAIDMLEELPVSQLPAVIITDLLMPGVVGTSLLAYVRSEPCLAGVSVAVMTSAPQLAPEGYPVFKKPLDLDALLGFVTTRVGARPPSPGAATNAP
jgi:two-component system, OmpR family, response regulator CpxR